MDDRVKDILVALQQALLGEVSPTLRAVTVEYDDTSVHFEAYYDGEITDDDREAMLRVDTEVMALFPETHKISHSVIRRDYPELIPKDRIWAYHRQEGNF